MAILGRYVVLLRSRLFPHLHYPSVPAHLWAVLIARIYEVFQLLCSMGGGQMRLIAFVTKGTQTRKILKHIGAESKPARICAARGSPL